MKKITDHFPLSATSGASTTSINSEIMRSMSESSNPMEIEEFFNICSEHNQFITSGGKEGKWQTFLAGGLVFGIFIAKNKTTKGKQADFSSKNLENSNLKEVSLPSANFLGVIYRNKDGSNSDFSNCLFTDSQLQGSSFENSNLENSDFSRSDMKNCNFRKANLAGTDFENCDLSGSDFTGAILTNSRFPGAKLLNVKF